MTCNKMLAQCRKSTIFHGLANCYDLFLFLMPVRFFFTILKSNAFYNIRGSSKFEFPGQVVLISPPAIKVFSSYRKSRVTVRSTCPRRSYLTRIHSALFESGAQHVGRVSGLRDLRHDGALLFAPQRQRGVPQAQRRGTDLSELAPSGHGRGKSAVIVPCVRKTKRKVTTRRRGRISRTGNAGGSGEQRGVQRRTGNNGLLSRMSGNSFKKWPTPLQKRRK